MVVGWCDPRHMSILYTIDFKYEGLDFQVPRVMLSLVMNSTSVPWNAIILSLTAMYGIDPNNN